MNASPLCSCRQIVGSGHVWVIRLAGLSLLAVYLSSACVLGMYKEVTPYSRLFKPGGLWTSHVRWTTTGSRDAATAI